LPKIYQKNSNQIFSLYFPLANEVKTSLTAEYFEKHCIKFSYPKIIQKNRHLDFILHQENQPFVPNYFYPKIIEPKTGEKIFPDFLILPLVAFDQGLSRLGMGGGFFDRSIEYLKNHKSKIVTVGLAYDFQRSKQTLPIEKTDQRLDFIVTEKFIFTAS
jgi:5-formyltetrahydrofolate cyclo-ligase